MAGWMANPWAQYPEKKRVRKPSAGLADIPEYPAADDEFPCEVADEFDIRTIDDELTPEDDIAAMRISAHGWERHIIEGAR
jgi:hypothetical protein